MNREIFFVIERSTQRRLTPCAVPSRSKEQASELSPKSATVIDAPEFRRFAQEIRRVSHLVQKRVVSRRTR